VLPKWHVSLALLRRAVAKQYSEIARRLADPSTVGFVSVASLWEMAIETRLRKLDPGMPLQDIAGYFEAIGLSILTGGASHVVAMADPETETREPFDRLLLAQCQVEGLRLVTFDRALLEHPLTIEI
jgi:PIN domain nuclease of toxin-antitoxin system